MKFTHTEVEEARSIKTESQQATLFEAAVRSVLQEGLTAEEDGMDFFARLAGRCHDYGVEREYAVMYTNIRYRKHSGWAVLAVGNFYDETRRTFGECRTMPTRQRMAFRLRKFLDDNFRLRYNVMKRQPEYSDKTIKQYYFMPVTERVLDTIFMSAASEGINCSANDLGRWLNATTVRDYYPMEDFLCRLPKWDGRERIKKLAQTVPTTDKRWPDKFYTWFLSMVHHWMTHDQRYANQMIPVLVGQQGCGKSQWIRALLPEEMQEYYHDGFDMRSPKAYQEMMVRYGLINIDEFDAMSERLEAVLKHVVQHNNPHINGEAHRRFCSFIATSNNTDLLHDTTGSRRYIFIKVTGQIQVKHRLSLQQIYAEAVEAVRNKKQTYFTDKEQAELQADNEAFRFHDVVEEDFHVFYECLNTGDDVKGAEWKSAAAIQLELEQLTKKKYGNRRSRTLGRVLAKLCSPDGHKRGNTSELYHVRRRNDR